LKLLYEYTGKLLVCTEKMLKTHGKKSIRHCICLTASDTRASEDIE